MFNKKILCIFCLLLVFIGISAVSAEDISSSYEVSDVDNTVLTFDDAQDKINHPNEQKVVVLGNNTFIADENKPITIDSDITVYGGAYANDRNSRSTLDANGLTNIFNIIGNHEVTLKYIDIINSKSTSSAILLNSNCVLILENVNFINCGIDSGTSNGGALYIGSKASVNAINVNFINNVAYDGGAVYVGSGASLSATNVNFIKNSATRFGGAVYVDSGASLSTNNVNFINNSAGFGGGIFGLEGMNNINVQNSYFYNNIATSTAGAIYGYTNVNITNSRFNKNSAGSTGGAVCGNNNINILNSLFEENTAKFGGAVSVESSVNIDGSTFNQNKAEVGGAIAVISSISASSIAQGTITNSVFDNNTATNGPGASIYFSGSLTVKDSIFASQGCEGGSNIFVPTEGSLSNENNLFASDLLDSNLGNNIIISAGNVANNKVILTIYVPYKSTGAINVYLNKDSVKNITNNKAENNKYSVEVSNLVAGKNNISVSFAGDSNFVSASDVVVVENTNKKNIDLSVSTSDITYGENAVVNIDCSVNGPIEVCIGNIITIVNVVNNKATIPVPNLDVGSYPVIATYAGNSTYNKKLAYSILNVAKAPSTLSIDCQASVFDATLYVLSNMPGYFIVYLDDEEYGSFYSNNGYLTVKMQSLGGGQHIVKVVSNNSNYELAEAKCAFSIYEPYKLALKSGVIYDGDTPDIGVSITRTDGNSISRSIIVVFTVNGTEIEVRPNINGWAYLNETYGVGDYSITVRFKDQAKYGYTVAKGYLIVKPLIIAEDIVRDNTGQFDYSVKLVDNKGDPSENKQLTFKIDGKTYSAMTNSNGEASISLNLAAGNYSMIITGPNSISIEKNIVILKNMPSLDISSNIVGNNATITATLGESASGDIIFDVNGEKHVVAISGNKAVLTLNNLPNNLYRINASLSSPGFAPLSSVDSFRINIPRDELMIESNPVEIEYKKPCNIVVKVTNLLNQPLSNLLVVTSINGVDYNAFTDSSGIAKFTISNLNSGYYKVYIYCEGNDIYHSKTIESSVKVTPINMSQMSLSTSVTDNDVIITATFPDKVPVGKVLFKVNGKEYYEVISNNKAVLKLTLSSKGNYTVYAYLNSINYNNLSNSTQFEIKSIRGVLHINAPVVDMYYKDGTKLIITVTDDRGNPLANIPLIIPLNGKDYNKTTDANGKIVIGINLLIDTYTVNIQFKGNSVYDPVNVTTFVIVKSTVLGSDLIKYYRNSSQLHVTILDIKGNPVAGVKASININGVFYPRVTDSNGVAILNIGLLPLTYIATVTNPVTGELRSFTVEVLSTIIINDLVKYYRNSSQLHIKFLDKQGNPLVGCKINININGVFYPRVTGTDGVAILNIGLLPMTYIATAIGPDLMRSCEVTVLSTIISKDLTMTTSSRVPFVVKVLDGRGNPAPIGSTVSLNINGVIYQRIVSDSSGTVQLGIGLMPGKYIITIYYNNLARSNTITIIK